MSDPDRMHDLVDALSDRSISDAQASELNQLLETDPAARRGFMNLMRLEAELGAIHQPLASWSFGDGAASVDAAESPTPSARRRDSSIRFLQFAGALAASVAISAIASSWLTYQTLRGEGPLASLASDRPAAEAAESGNPPPPVARVAATRNCRWSGERTDLGFGAEVTGGQTLRLETGLAELTFAGGARLVLEGPAAFRIPDEDTVELYRGRVAAAIPSDAKAFSVRTPRLVVAESGAQYGVVAGSHGGDEVHVFEGDIEARAVNGSGRVTGVVNLASLEAARFGVANHRFAVFNADDEGFVRSLETRTGPGEGLLAFDNFSYPTGPLAWQNGGFGWAGPWADLEAEPSADRSAAPTNGVARGSIATLDVVALGNRFVQSGNANRVRRTLSTSIGGVFDSAGLVENVDGLRLIGRNGTTLYVGFLQRVSKTDDVFYGVELHRGDGNFNRVLCVGNGVDEHGYGVTSSFLQEKKVAKYEPLGDENTDVNLIVVRIDFGEGAADDVATVYRNPESLTDESRCTPAATLRGLFAFDRVSLGNFEGSKVHEVDELRIGTDFRAVTGRMAAPGLQREGVPPIAWWSPAPRIQLMNPGRS